MDENKLKQAKVNKRISAEIEYRVSYWVDEDFWNEENLKTFSDVFYSVETPDDIAKHVIQCVIRLGENVYVEGVGYIMINGRFPWGVKEEDCSESIKLEYDTDPEIEIY